MFCCTYVGLLSFRLRLHGLSRLEQICWNMLIEAAQSETSNLFLQSEPVTEKCREKEKRLHSNVFDLTSLDTLNHVTSLIERTNLNISLKFFVVAFESFDCSHYLMTFK
ncbi:CLUMA_CG010719, isoform A [Clunio marinus]|uniref:CLUMA_CG010719, isoform A n=1 Tax=Clunio marinus TaxID=568069 RepID=A0A1J1IAL2_9DIPT|nr:CLUMA_CG010719, isoform A [Clunio marinus]